MLATLEPTTLPMANSVLPCPAARPETSSSGALVPNPMTATPMKTGETRSLVASRAEPTTK
jgi:hypothetical protein